MSVVNAWGRCEGGGRGEVSVGKVVNVGYGGCVWEGGERVGDESEVGECREGGEYVGKGDKSGRGDEKGGECTVCGKEWVG